MDGRSVALGGGMNALEPETTNGLFIAYNLPYQLKELSSRSLRAAFETNWMDLEGGWTQTGDEVYMENYVSMSAARDLSGTFRLKAKIGFYNYALITGEKGSTLLSEIGCIITLYEKMQINVYAFNPSGSRISLSENTLPLTQSIHVGINFKPVNKLEGLLEIEKVLKQIPILHMGLEYKLCEELVLRTGLSCRPIMSSWGVGGNIRRLHYSLGANNHPSLGYSSCFSIYYNW